MIEAISQLNWLAVVIAVIAHAVLGGVWFTALFGRQYAAALGIADRPTEKPAPIFVMGPLMCSVFTIVTTAVLMRRLGIGEVAEAIGLGAFIGVGYLAAMTMNIAINPLFPRPFRYALVNAPMFVAGSMLAAAILAAMS